MGSFSEAELSYLQSQRLGRLATVGADGKPHVAPVTFRYNPDTDTIDVGGLRNRATKKFRDVSRVGVAAIVVDDVVPPWSPRGIEVRGPTVALDEAEKFHDAFDGSLIRITPERIVAWGLEGDARRPNARTVSAPT